MAKVYELIANVKYKGKPRKIGEKIEIDDKDLEFFRARKLIKANGEEVPSNDPPKEKPFSQMNATELKAIAAELGVAGFDSMTKEQLREAIQEKNRLAELMARAKEAGIDGYETMTEEELLKVLGE